jgi:hypothetical protein
MLHRPIVTVLRGPAPMWMRHRVALATLNLITFQSVAHPRQKRLAPTAFVDVVRPRTHSRGTTSYSIFTPPAQVL